MDPPVLISIQLMLVSQTMMSTREMINASPTPKLDRPVSSAENARMEDNHLLSTPCGFK
ncbi:hypothetical protein NC652_040322 [Populus alba x Populus x berolinensis]|nr:hypothetical protein NC652_040322 [Populus alba x Populus x berolinensis]